MKALQSLSFDALRVLWIKYMLINANPALVDPEYSDACFARSYYLNLIEKEWNRRSLANGPTDYFKWPSTEAKHGNGQIDSSNWITNGLLKFMDYQVGNSSTYTTSQRQALLSIVFQMEIPPVFPVEYINQFGKPSSSNRLQKIAESIAAFTRNAKRKSHDMHAAIQDWEEDLNWLYHTFYVGRFKFSWPKTGTPTSKA